jgi:hypothetical protein
MFTRVLDSSASNFDQPIGEFLVIGMEPIKT